MEKREVGLPIRILLAIAATFVAFTVIGPLPAGGGILMGVVVGLLVHFACNAFER